MYVTLKDREAGRELETAGTENLLSGHRQVCKVQIFNLKKEPLQAQKILHL